MITPSFNLTATERVLPRLALDFTTASLDPRVTFTRAANTATVVNSAGNIEVVNADTPRFDFNPTTLVCQGLLIEETQTNSLRNNTAAGAVAGTPGTAPTNWVVSGSGSGLTREIVGVGTENGVDYIDIKYSGTPSATVGFQVNFEGTTQVVAANGQTWTSSAYVKLAAGSLANTNSIYVNIAGRDALGNGIAGQSGITAALTPTSANILTQRQTTSFTFSSASVAFVRSGFQFSVTNGLAVDVTFRFGLPQLELGAFATSAIKTSTAAVTRNADVATMTGTNFSDWFNATEGSFFVRGSRNDQVSFGAFLSANAGSTANEMYITQQGSVAKSFVRKTAGVSGDLTMTGAWATQTTRNVVFSYKLNDLVGAFNGNVVATDNTSDIPTATILSIGTRAAAGLALNGYIEKISYWPQRLINAENQAFSK